MTPRATYRFQFNRDFTFADAAALVPYLNELGISHVYASPIAGSRAGSRHGYDVVDPARVDPELGGEAALRVLVAELRRHGMGLIVDIVPNHMGIAGGENSWWNDVLANGRQSEFAEFFDIDWSEKLLLPFLGEPLDDAIRHGALELRRGEDGTELWAHGEHRFPLRPEDREADPSSDLAEILERQPYRLCWWRRGNDELNWRRFFTITELASLRVEVPRVFEAVHALVFRLHDEGLIDGVRVDHVDGLTDPAQYCRRLRQRLGAEAYIVVEKILSPEERVPDEWEIDGTTGYDFMEQVGALLHNPAGEEPLASLWQRISGRPGDFAAEELRARQDMLSWEFEAQLSACVRAFVDLAGSAQQTAALTAGMLRRALCVLLWSFPAYRTYGTGGTAPISDVLLREQAQQRARPLAPPGEMGVIDQVLTWLAGEGPGEAGLASEAVRRFQQLSAPIAAKAVEDTAFYRYGRLLSRNDVGSDPGRLSMAIDDFAAACCERFFRFPHAMLATATHDHKRGEETRARLAVLSDVPELWRQYVERWEQSVAPGCTVDSADRYMLYQTLFGAWPDDSVPYDAQALGAFASRLSGWQEKALREAKLRSSWAEPNETYEAECRQLLERLLDPRRSAAFLSDLSGFVTQTRSAALANSLVQTLLKFLLPGVPDVYQGCELPDWSLVDPDNRRPVDYDLRQRLLRADEGQPPKFALVRQLLQIRRDHPALFANGEFAPANVHGARAGHVFAFSRRAGDEVLRAAVSLRCGAELIGKSAPVVDSAWWDRTGIDFGFGLTAHAAALFAQGPVAFKVAALTDDLEDWWGMPEGG